MTHYSYTNKKLRGYEDAIALVVLANEKLNDAKSELTEIKGFPKCTNLGNSISDKVIFLEDKMKEIQDQKTEMLKRAERLDQEEKYCSND